MNETITLSIDTIGGLGDGVARHEGGRVMVPRTAPGDVVEARLTGRKGDASFAELVRILTPSPERVVAPCAHFGVCGGCALQHLGDVSYGVFKQRMVMEAVERAGFKAAAVAPLMRIPMASRRRAALRVLSDEGSVRLGYREEGSHRTVPVTQCTILTPALGALVEMLPQALQSLPAHALPLTVHLTETETGFDVVANGTGSLSSQDVEAWKALAERFDVARLHWGDELLVLRCAPEIYLDDVRVIPPPGAFLQASREGQTALVAEALGAMDGARDVADLFAGLGTFTFPLAKGRARVLAVEGELSALAALGQAAKRHGKSQVRTEHRDLFANPLTIAELAGFDGVVIDPPRAGAKAQMKRIAEARAPKVCLVSCNPATFGRDATALKQAGYRLTRAVGVDQFVYSAHVEMVASFEI